MGGFTLGARTLSVCASDLPVGLEDRISSSDDAVDNCLVAGSGSVTEEEDTGTLL